MPLRRERETGEARGRDRAGAMRAVHAVVEEEPSAAPRRRAEIAIAAEQGDQRPLGEQDRDHQRRGVERRQPGREPLDHQAPDQDHHRQQVVQPDLDRRPGVRQLDHRLARIVHLELRVARAEPAEADVDEADQERDHEGTPEAVDRDARDELLPPRRRPGLPHVLVVRARRGELHPGDRAGRSRRAGGGRGRSPGRSSTPRGGMSGYRCNSPPTSVPVRGPAPGCTSIPAGFTRTTRSESS